MNVRTFGPRLVTIGLLLAATTPCIALASHGSDDSRNSSTNSSSGSSRGSDSSSCISKKSAKTAKPLRLVGSVGSDNNGIKVKAKYEEKSKKQSVTQKFDAEVEGASPGQVFEVRVGGQLVGTMTANQFGHAELELRQNPDSADDLPLPAGFPRLKAGDTVQIGDSTVTLRKR